MLAVSSSVVEAFVASRPRPSVPSPPSSSHQNARCAFATAATTLARRDDAGAALARDGGHDPHAAAGRACLVAGATGYIGRAVVREAVRRGYDTYALVRNATAVRDDPGGVAQYRAAFHGATVLECDVADAAGLAQLVAEVAAGRHATSAPRDPRRVDVLVSCLASPTGTAQDARDIDYQATLNFLNAGRDGRVRARHFVLLSAFCVRRPLLQLQQAKLQFEAELRSQTEMTYSIVRPTAFFKSVTGQLESVQQGNSYVLFGDGAVTRCNPISEEDLAEYMLLSALEEGMKNQILNVGGPDEPLSNKMIGEMMFKAIGKPPKFVYVPTWIFDASIALLGWMTALLGSEKWEDALESAKIGKYYAVEDMLTVDSQEKYGTSAMQSYLDKIAAGGQDPFTPVRATAYISRTLEALPALPLSILLGYGLMANAGEVGAFSGDGLIQHFQLLAASLTDT